MVHHQVQLKNFKLELDTEYTKFYNTCENLLQELDDIDRTDVQSMLNPSNENNGSLLWSSQALEDALFRKLNDRSAYNFRENVNAMHSELCELSEYFPVETESKVPIPSLLKYITCVLIGTLRNHSPESTLRRSSKPFLSPC